MEDGVRKVAAVGGEVGEERESVAERERVAVWLERER